MRVHVKRALLLVPALLSWACGNDADPSSTSSSSSSSSAGGTTSGAGGAEATTGATGSSTGTGEACPSCGAPADAFVPATAELTEASGLVASAVHQGVLYAHNDSGDTARFFAIGAAGEALGTYNLTGAGAVDWEDMARGPCADASKSCLYFGDVGDNKEVRATYVVYRVEEPASLSAGEHPISFETFTFQYPDGSHNCETLLVHPTTGVVTVVTKNASGSAAYEMPMPLRSGATVTLGAAQPVAVGGLVPLVTAGDVHPNGDSVLLRTYVGVFLYPIGPGETAAQALSRAPCELPTPGEQQGETVAWSRSGTEYFTISEGAGQTLHRVSCR